jgi:hypothetical protein
MAFGRPNPSRNSKPKRPKEEHVKKGFEGNNAKVFQFMICKQVRSNIISDRRLKDHCQVGRRPLSARLSLNLGMSFEDMELKESLRIVHRLGGGCWTKSRG